jgi:hypothetical protein
MRVAKDAIRAFVLAIPFVVFIIILLGAPSVDAQTTPSASTKLSGKITTGNTFQLLQAASPRRSMTVQNNNATGTETCFLLIGGPWVAGDTTASTRTVNGATITAANDAILLPGAGGSYSRYFPYIPSDQLLITCATNNDTFYADVQ